MSALFVALTVGSVACGTDRPTAPFAPEIAPAYATSVSSVEIATNSAYMGDSVVMLKGASVDLALRTVNLSRVRAGSWTSSSPSIVSVTSGGLRGTATGVNKGVSTVTFKAAALTETAKVWSLDTTDIGAISITGLADTMPAGQTYKVRVRVPSHAYGTLQTTLGTFTSSDTMVAAFNHSMLSGKKPGVITLSVTALGKSDSRRVVLRGAATAGLISNVDSLVVGDSASPTAAFVDAADTPVPCTTWQWTSSAPTLISLARATSAKPTVTGVAIGAATLSVKCDNGPTATYGVRITAPAPPTAPPASPAPPGSMIDLRFLRIDSSVVSPNVFVSAGVPMAKGRINAVDVDKIRILVNGVEVARHASALLGKHSDGSLRSVLVQLTVPVANLNQPVKLEFGNRTMAPLAKVTPTAIPQAILSYVSLDELIATDIVGPTKARSDIPNTAAFWSQYESNWNTWEETHYASNMASYFDQYYDRVNAYFGFFARTGNAKYFARGAQLTRRYRDEYIVPNGYGIPEWQAFIDGMASHYWLTGDDSTRNTILRVASNFETFRGRTDLMRGGDIAGSWMDNRVMGRSLGLKVLALRLGATSLPAGGSAPPIADLRAAAATDLEDILAMQKFDGSWRFAAQCGQSSNFMTGMLTGVLGDYYDDVSADARIPEKVGLAWTFLRTQWLPSSRTFQYYSGDCPGHGGAYSAGDLNGLFLDGLGWLYKFTGDQKLRELGDDVYRGSVDQTFLSGYKQFNQQYQYSWRWLGYR